MEIDEYIKDMAEQVSRFDESYREFFASFVNQLETHAGKYSFIDSPKVINAYEASLTVLGKKLTVRLEAVKVRGFVIVGKIKGIDNQTQTVMTEFCINGFGEVLDCENNYESVKPKSSLGNGENIVCDINCVALNFIWNCIEDGNYWRKKSHLENNENVSFFKRLGF